MKDDDAVSAVVSAVLLFTLFSTAFALWSLNTLPEWVADREHSHALGAASDLSSLAADLDATPLGEQASRSIDLAPRRVPLLQTNAATGSLVVEPGFSFSASYTGEGAFLIGDAVVASPTTGLPYASGIASIRALELAFDGPGNNQNGYVQVTAFSDADADGTLDADEPSVQARLGKRSAAGATLCGGAEAYLEVRSGQGASPPLVATDVLVCGPDNAASFSVDVMQPARRFAGLLGRLGDGFSITGQHVGAGTGRAAMVWSDVQGITRATGAGAATEMDSSLAGVRLDLRTSYQEFVPRTISLEGGGVINSEEHGAAFVQDPVFVMARDGSQAFLRWRVLDMSGSGALSGDDAATVRMTKTASTDFVLRVPAGGAASFALDTAAPMAWQQLWTDARVLGRLDVGDITVAADEQGAELQLASSLSWTIHLTIVNVDVRVT